MTTILRFAKTLFQRQPLPRLRFPTTGLEILGDSSSVALEEEQFEKFGKGIYYPVNIGDVFASGYQVIGKLGFGVTSTVWLARDLQ